VRAKNQQPNTEQTNLVNKKVFEHYTRAPCANNSEILSHASSDKISRKLLNYI